MKESKMKIGLILENTSSSQLAFFAISNMNKFASDNYEDDLVLFFENAVPHVIQPSFACMNSSEIWNFDGVLVSTSVSNTLLSVSAIAPKKRYFYVWDLEWTRPRGKNYEYNISAYSDKDVSLIARSDDHAKAIKNYCNRDVCGIVSNFNLNQLMDVINNEQVLTKA